MTLGSGDNPFPCLLQFLEATSISCLGALSLFSKGWLKSLKYEERFIFLSARSLIPQVLVVGLCPVQGQ